MFKIGLYEREITPLFGNNLCGYFNARPVSGVKDKTYAKAVVISSCEKKLAMLSIDACMLDEETIDAIRKRVCAYSDIEDSLLLISATHSHTASPCAGESHESTREIDRFYLKWLAMAGADTVLLANQRLEDAKISFTETEISGTTFVRNYLMRDGSVRTNPGVLNPDIIRPIAKPDYTAPVMFFENASGKKIGMIYSFANHQDSVSGEEVSADWSGVVSKEMKRKFGEDFISIFFIGTAGNVNQIDVNCKKPDYNPECCYQELGRTVYKAIASTLPSLSALEGEISEINEQRLYRTRLMTDAELKEQKAISDAVSLPRGIKLDASSPKEYFKACMANRAIKHNETAEKEREVRFQVIKIGYVLIFALPGEVYSQFGERIRSAFPKHKCFFACLANNGWSYMPTKECYLPELYESLFGSSKFYPEDTEAIFDRFIELGRMLTEK